MRSRTLSTLLITLAVSGAHAGQILSRAELAELLVTPSWSPHWFADDADITDNGASTVDDLLIFPASWFPAVAGGPCP